MFSYLYYVLSIFSVLPFRQQEWVFIFRRSSTCGYENIAFQAIKATITVHVLSIFFMAKINK
jgi:hypothetical protein